MGSLYEIYLPFYILPFQVHVHVLHLQALLSVGSLYEIYLPFYILPFQVLQSVKVLDFRNSQLQSIFGCQEGNGIRENFKIWC